MVDLRQKKLKKSKVKMLRTSFSCNSLKIKHLFFFLWILLTKRNRQKLTSLFINEISKYFKIDKENIFLFGSARMGLFTLLKSLNTQKEDEIIVAGYTCVVVTNAIKYAGLKAVYVDIDETTLNISTEKIYKAVTEKTKAIIITHNFGIVYEDIEKLKKDFSNIIIIEDAAHTFGSTDQTGRKVGLIGDVSFFSLEYSKPLTTGMGGILFINNPELLSDYSKEYKVIGNYPAISNFRIFITLKAHLLTSYKYSVFLKGALFRILKKFRMLFRSSEDELQGEMPRHYPVRLSPYLAVFGFLQMKEIYRINRIKNEITKGYNTTLKSIPGIAMFYSNRYNYVRYPVLFEKKVSYDTIEKIKEDLSGAGISVGEWFNDVVHPKGSFRYCYIKGFCNIGESVSKRIINLPVNIHYRPSQKDLREIRNIFKKHLEKV